MPSRPFLMEKSALTCFLNIRNKIQSSISFILSYLLTSSKILFWSEYFSMHYHYRLELAIAVGSRENLYLLLNPSRFNFYDTRNRNWRSIKQLICSRVFIHALYFSFFNRCYCNIRIGICFYIYNITYFNIIVFHNYSIWKLIIRLFLHFNNIIKKFSPKAVDSIFIFRATSCWYI